ncbi:MAG: hypothetical protein N0A16_12465, partial [Blastocatellia bacterium]|nr:hypothetical protein [Blastocatellia bacterium]
MTRRGIVKIAFAAGMMGLLLVPALVYTQVTGQVLNPRLRQSYPSLSAAVAAAAANDTLLVSGTLSGTNAILDSATDTLPAGLKIVAGRGLRGTLRVTSQANCVGNVILNVSNRQGPVLIQGLTLVVPDECTGIYSDGAVSNGAPLTVRGVLIQRAAATASINGIFLYDEFDGPFLIEQNVIQSTGTTGGFVDGTGILVDGDGANPITATVRGNRVGQAGATTQDGIYIEDVPTGSDVVVERNIVDGGNQSGSETGIWVYDSDGVI